MMNRILLIVAISLTLVSVSVNARGSKKAVDVVDYETWKDETIVDLLCYPKASSSREISRISTITWLYEYFESLNWNNIPADAPISQCYKRYKEPLEHLQTIVALGRENACSETKIAIIEDFQRRYILGPLFQEYIEGQASIPEPLLLFFMRYMVEVTEACKWGLFRNLHRAEKYVDVRSMLAGGAFGPLVNVLQTYFAAPSIIRDFTDFVHIWDMVDDYGRRVGDLPRELMRDHETGDRSGFMVKVKSATGFLALQQQCQMSLRPIYGPLVLPLMRLVELGYHMQPYDLSADQLIRDWYNIAQVCEALLPIRVFEDRYLEPSKVELISPEEAAQLRNSEQIFEGGPIAFQFDPSVLTQVDVLESVYQQDPRDLINDVHLNIKIRRQYFKRLIKQLSLQFKHKLKSRLENFSMSPGYAQATHSGGYPSGGPILSGSSLDGDYLLDGGPDAPYDAHNYAPPRHGLSRHKRAPFGRRRKKTMSAQEQALQPSAEQKKTLRQRVKRVAIIMILMAVISTLVGLVIWFSRG